jgi:hypothetical protein
VVRIEAKLDDGYGRYLRRWSLQAACWQSAVRPSQPESAAKRHRERPISCQDGTATELHRRISMDDEIEIQDLAADEIRELLLADGSELNEQQATALKQFIEDIGGMENALAAIAMLDSLEKAA